MKAAARWRRTRELRRLRHRRELGEIWLARRNAWAELRTRTWLPREDEYYLLIASMEPSDGSTSSPDWICGVEIGRSGDDSYPPLPATLHDFFFARGGGLGAFRRANHVFRDYLLLYVLELYDRELWTQGQVQRRVRLYAWAVNTWLAARHFAWRS